MRTIVPKIGTTGFIIGHRLISDDTWKRTYPQNIYGKVIDHVKIYVRGKCIGINLLIRCTYKKRGKTKVEHYHLKTEIMYFKPLQ